jgi:CRISPR-associated protein Csm5
MKYGHLERINLTLRTLSPLFIGSGEKLSKKEYILDPKKAIIYFPHLPKFMVFLQQRGILVDYEAFLLQSRQNDLRAFLQDHHIEEKDYQHFVAYHIPAGEAIKSLQFREVLTFLKGADGRPYIPGSSIKGAIRTALGALLIKSVDRQRFIKQVQNADHRGNIRWYLNQEENSLEQKLFCRLEYKDTSGKMDLSKSPINDIMRGIQISDSAPLDYERLTLCGKVDRKPDGSVNSLPIFRECLMPGSEARMVMTLDLPMLKRAGWDKYTIEQALHQFADEHYANYEQSFPEDNNDAPIAAQQGVDMILGGGAGYVSKTLMYNLFNERKEAMSMVSQIMHRQFKTHGHNKDLNQHRVSPHTLKTTRYQELYYQMGRCELILG